ncbi:MAG: patatin-like phospholipase family protein [Anaerolineae bacterium]|nr:patatin-like phospholipase family protein [Anaerolineae bacterium]
MRAFVLSGGANYGALQVGALDALLSYGLHPDIIVGVSAGAINAAWFATHPDLNGIGQLARIWCHIAPQVFRPLDQASMLLQLALRRESVLSNTALQRFICKFLPAETRFGDLSNPRLYVTAARLADGAPRVFGDDPDDRLLDGLMASTAIPPLFPPWRMDGTAYVDGGIVSNLPLQVAIERGADEVFALLNCLSLTGNDGNAPHGMSAVSIHAIALMIDHQVEHEIEMARRDADVRLHLIRLCPGADPGFWSFARAEELIADGRRAAQEYLTQEHFVEERTLAWIG